MGRGGFLEPVTRLVNENTGGVGLDVHLRRNDEVHVYCGMARVLTAQRLRGGDVKLTAHRTYTSQSCAKGLFRTWRTGETGLSRALTAYARDVDVGSRWTKAEGAVQMQWSRVRKPWTPFDREVVLERQAEATSFPKVRSALADVDEYRKPQQMVGPEGRER